MERQLGGAAAGPARSSRRKSTLLAVPSLLDEKEFLQQMRAGPLDRRFPLFVGLGCMLFHTNPACGTSDPLQVGNAAPQTRSLAAGNHSHDHDWRVSH